MADGLLATLAGNFIRQILKTMPAAPAAQALSDAEFHRLTQAVLAQIEATADRWLEDDVLDVDVQRSGGLLELSFPNGSKIVVNTQPPLHELWMASRAAGQHFKLVQGQWLDTRDGSEFFAALSQQASAQGARVLQVLPPGG